MQRYMQKSEIAGKRVFCKLDQLSPRKAGTYYSNINRHFVVCGVDVEASRASPLNYLW